MHSYAFARTHLPYCLRRTSDGQWIALNREYTPLGVIGGDRRASYDNHPSRIRLDAETIAYLRGVTVHLAGLGDPRDPDCVYLYTGMCPPTEDPRFWRAYARVLQRVAGVTREADPDGEGVMARTLETEVERERRIERGRQQDRHLHQIESEAVH